MAASTTRLEAVERQLERVIAVVPYLLLAISATLSLLTGDLPVGDRLITLGLAVLAAVWMWAMSARRTPGAVYVAGLIVFIAALSLRDIWFASFFAFSGYLHSWQYLPGVWRIVGVTATAAVTITAFTGGLPEPTPAAITTYLIFIAAIVVLVSLFSFVGQVTQERSAERQRMVAQLEATIRENEGLHAQLLMQAREAGAFDERQRIAREIHDTIAQGLAGIVTQLQAAERAGERGATADWRRHLADATHLARQSLDEARRSVHAIGPGPLESAHLPDAIATVATEWSERTGVGSEVIATGTPRPLHPEVEVTLLRVAQEALANVAKHAEATRVGLTLSYMDDVVTLDVRDDGVGFDIALTPENGAYGLTSMRQRAALLGGTLHIESGAGAGTAVSTSLPAIPREGTSD